MDRSNFTVADVNFAHNSAYYGGSTFITANLSDDVTLQRLQFASADFAKRGASSLLYQSPYLNALSIFKLLAIAQFETQPFTKHATGFLNLSKPKDPANCMGFSTFSCLTRLRGYYPV